MKASFIITAVLLCIANEQSLKSGGNPSHLYKMHTMLDNLTVTSEKIPNSIDAQKKLWANFLQHLQAIDKMHLQLDEFKNESNRNLLKAYLDYAQFVQRKLDQTEVDNAVYQKTIDFLTKFFKDLSEKNKQVTIIEPFVLFKPIETILTDHLDSEAQSFIDANLIHQAQRKLEKLHMFRNVLKKYNQDTSDLDDTINYLCAKITKKIYLEIIDKLDKNVHSAWNILLTTTETTLKSLSSILSTDDPIIHDIKLYKEFISYMIALTEPTKKPSIDPHQFLKTLGLKLKMFFSQAKTQEDIDELCKSYYFMSLATHEVREAFLISIEKWIEELYTKKPEAFRKNIRFSIARLEMIFQLLSKEKDKIPQNLRPQFEQDLTAYSNYIQKAKQNLAQINSPDNISTVPPLKDALDIFTESLTRLTTVLIG